MRELLSNEAIKLWSGQTTNNQSALAGVLLANANSFIALYLYSSFAGGER